MAEWIPTIISFVKKCAKIYDIDLHPCPALQRSEVNGHVIHELQGYFYGICRDCRERVDNNEEIRSAEG